MTELRMESNEYFHLVYDYPANKTNYEKKYFIGLTFNKDYKTTSIKECNDLLKPILQGLKSIKHILLVPEFHKDKSVHYHGWMWIKNMRKWYYEERFIFDKYGSLHQELPNDQVRCNQYIIKNVYDSMFGARSLPLLRRHHGYTYNHTINV